MKQRASIAGILDNVRIGSSGEMQDLMIRGLASRPRGYVLAVDFDGTLCENGFPSIGAAKDCVIRAVRRVQALGVTVVLWTCREGQHLMAAVGWCSDRGLVFDAVNENPEHRKQLYRNDPRKLGYDELWDDLARTPMGWW